MRSDRIKIPANNNGISIDENSGEEQSLPEIGMSKQDQFNAYRKDAKKAKMLRGNVVIGNQTEILKITENNHRRNTTLPKQN